MTGNNDINRRIKALEEIIRPSESLEARVAALSEMDRKVYDEWKRKCREQSSKFDAETGGYYEAYINGEIEIPQLPRHVKDKIFDPEPQLTKDMSPSEMNEAYRKFMEGKR